MHGDPCCERGANTAPCGIVPVLKRHLYTCRARLLHVVDAVTVKAVSWLTLSRRGGIS